MPPIPRRPFLLSLWFALLLACLAPSALAGHRLAAHIAGSQLSGTVDYLVDDERERELADVLDPAVQAAFLPHPGNLRTGYDGRPVWLRITLTQSGRPGDWLLALPTTGIQDLQFFGPVDAAGNALAAPVRTGMLHPYASRPLGSERYVFRVLLPASGHYTAYLRIVSRTGQSLDLSAWDPATYMASRQDKRIFDGLAYGILLTLLIYNLVLAVSLRDRTHGLYVLNCAFALMTIASFNGHAAHYLFPNWTAAIARANVVAPSLWLLCGALFARDFLELPARRPWMNRVSLVVMALSALALVPGLLGHVSLAQQFNEVLSLTGVVLFTLIGGAVALRGGVPARWYLGGQGMLFVSVLLLVLANRGIVQSPFMVANGLQLGILVEMVVFSIALSGRIRRIRKETIVLQKHAGRLAVQAQTDPLTGLANRAGLAARAEALLSEPGPHGLMMIDLDRFKPVNDTFGHQVGDRVLVELARRIASAVRALDTVARVGGDEFVVLLPNAADRASLEAQADRLRKVIQAPVTFEQGEARLGCSIGVAIHPLDGGTFDELVARADRAMYGEKRTKAARA